MHVNGTVQRNATSHSLRRPRRAQNVVTLDLRVVHTAERGARPTCWSYDAGSEHSSHRDASAAGTRFSSLK